MYYDARPPITSPAFALAVVTTAALGIFVGSLLASHTSPPPSQPLVGINCASSEPVMLAEEEDLFPAPCDEVLSMDDYCSTDYGVEDEICVDPD